MGFDKNKLKVLGISINDKLSNHFTLKEMLVSETASREGIDNTPLKHEVEALRQLCVNVLEPLRSGLRLKFNNNSVLLITSGYRGKKLNTAIKGSKTSQHVSGEAADFHMWGINLFDVFKYIVCESGIEFDQCIWEFDNWIHISYKHNQPNRNEVLSVVKVGNKNVWHAHTQQSLKELESEEEL